MWLRSTVFVIYLFVYSSVKRVPRNNAHFLSYNFSLLFIVIVECVDHQFADYVKQ